MIKIENVSKAFREKIVLSKISFTANEGEVTALIGPNGSGKSTLLKILLGLISTDEGRATFDGKNYGELGKYPFRYVGTFLDSFQPNPTRTAYNHLRWIALTSGISKQRCLECLKIVGLQDVGNKKIKDYSLGMKQKIYLAGAFMSNAQNIILDEPFNAIDPESTFVIKKILFDLKDTGKMILFSVHNLDLVSNFCDKIIFIDNRHSIFECNNPQNFDVLEKIFFDKCVIKK